MMLNDDHYDHAGLRAEVLAVLDAQIAQNPTHHLTGALMSAREQVAAMTADHAGVSIKLSEHVWPQEPGTTVAISCSEFPAWVQIRTPAKRKPYVHPVPPMNIGNSKT